MSSKHSYLGFGVYSFSQVSRLLRLSKSSFSSRSIRRWMKGYSTVVDGTRHDYKPLIVSDFADYESESDAISFRDLIEILFVSEFLKYKVSVQTIRKASDELCKLVAREHHPFGSNRFGTDGHRILARTAEEEGDANLMDLVSHQLCITSILGPSLTWVEFNELDFATRWWPLGKNKKVVIDPQRQLGQPILTDTGIPTATLYAAFNVQKSVKEVASWFEIDIDSVKDACTFESRLAS